MMTLVYTQTQEPGVPAVHVLIIAVDDYPYLDKGTSRPTFEQNGGLGQLKSPSYSAAALSNWLLSDDYQPHNSVLGSIEVLANGPATFRGKGGPKKLGKKIKVATPSMQNVRTAADAWYARGDSHAKNFMMFYFCGHGVSSGDIHSLLLPDFGEYPRDPFTTGAIDAEAFMDGCRPSKARSQLFLIDACRTVDHSTFGTFSQHRGAPVLSAAAHANLGVIEQACLWATKLGTSAYGNVGAASVFMNAMLAAMTGAGSVQDPEDEAAKWVIRPDMLKAAMDYLVRRTTGENLQYVELDRYAQEFYIHVLPGKPRVPVRVSCSPTERTSVASLKCSSGDSRDKGMAGPWHLDLSSDYYKFDAVMTDTGAVVSKNHPAVPPYSLVSLNV